MKTLLLTILLLTFSSTIFADFTFESNEQRQNDYQRQELQNEQQALQNQQQMIREMHNQNTMESLN